MRRNLTVSAKLCLIKLTMYNACLSSEYNSENFKETGIFVVASYWNKDLITKRWSEKQIKILISLVNCLILFVNFGCIDIHYNGLVLTY